MADLIAVLAGILFSILTAILSIITDAVGVIIRSIQLVLNHLKRKII